MGVALARCLSAEIEARLKRLSKNSLRKAAYHGR